MFICETCGAEFLVGTNNHKICPSCLGRMGGRKKSKPKDKQTKLHPGGYLYYTHSMLAQDELMLLPDDGRIILVHRLVMAKKLGRPLVKGEIVMHIDGDKTNNDPGNLMLGDSMTNSRQHWEARIEAVQWQQISIALLGMVKKLSKP